jgi:hypothetical protein
VSVACRTGNGLPATSIEIFFIERVRARREWTLDREVDAARSRVLVEREIHQWRRREQQIQM